MLGTTSSITQIYFMQVINTYPLKTLKKELCTKTGNVPQSPCLACMFHPSHTAIQTILVQDNICIHRNRMTIFHSLIKNLNLY
jgi:hypothetical protein